MARKPNKQEIDRAASVAVRENMAGDGRLRVRSTYRAKDGSGVGITLNDGRSFPLPVSVLHILERSMAAEHDRRRKG
jgi:hypothetical protein